MVAVIDCDNTGHFVPVRRLPSGFLFSWLPLDNLLYGEEREPIEVASMVPNGSIVIGIGDKDKRYYIVQTIDIVYAAYQADQALRDRSCEKNGRKKDVPQNS
jgi:hypothetical protein